MRTINQIQDDLIVRLASAEFIPSFLQVTVDYTLFVTAVAKFIAPYIQALESYTEIYGDADLLRAFLESRSFFTSGVTEETLAELQSRANNQYKQLCARGTLKMNDEVMQVCGDYNTDTLHPTAVFALDQSECGWWAGFTSPEYITEESTPNGLINMCYLGLDQIFLFHLRNFSVRRTDQKLQEILQQYFEPKHVQSIYYFV